MGRSRPRWPPTPALAEQARDREPHLVGVAAETGRPEAVRLAIRLGWDVDAGNPTALHQTALRGDLAMVRLLVDLGADPSVADWHHDATPAGWADWAGHPDVARYLRDLER